MKMKTISLANPMILATVIFSLLGGGAWLVRYDIGLTRITANKPQKNQFEPLRVHPVIGSILESLSLREWKYHTNGLENYQVSPALEFVNREIRYKSEFSSEHRKLWDFLDEAYMQSNDLLIAQAYQIYTSSLYFSEPIHQEGLCDYLSKRILPAIAIYIEREDYGGARRLVSEANRWMDSAKKDDDVANNFPRFQAYLNIFRKLDVWLFDLNLLYSKKSEMSKVLKYITGEEKAHKSTTDFLRKSDNDELQNWGNYLDGSRHLNAFDYLNAIKGFDGLKSTSNPKLEELAILGAIRSTYWACITEKIEKASAKNRILQYANKLKTKRFERDVAMYLNRLAVEKEAAEEELT